MNTAYPTLNFGLGEELDMLRDAVYQMCQKEVAPRAADIDRDNEFPADLWRKFGDMGLLGITVDEAYGGSGMGYLAHSLVMEEISRASASVGLSYGAMSNLCLNQINKNGNEEQKQKYLPRAVQRRTRGRAGHVRTQCRFRCGQHETAARKDGDNYILNGTKMWITNGPDADVYIIYAKTDIEAGSKGITAFIVERDYPGFSRSPKLDKLGMRGSNTCELVFEDCRVPAENVLRNEGDGVKILMSGLDYERTVLSGGPVGIMQACVDEVLPYLHDRKQFGQSIGEFQLMQGKLADMYADLNACRAYLYAVAGACDRGEETRQDCAAVILYTAEKATQMALQAIQALGGFGYTNDANAGRLLRDAKLYEIGAGTSEVRRMLIGRELFNATA